MEEVSGLGAGGGAGAGHPEAGGPLTPEAQLKAAVVVGF